MAAYGRYRTAKTVELARRAPRFAYSMLLQLKSVNIDVGGVNTDALLAILQRLEGLGMPKDLVAPRPGTPSDHQRVLEGHVSAFNWGLSKLSP
jgi:hypothetical protein